MKRAVAFFFLLACSGLLLGDSPNRERSARKPAPLLEDLVRMTGAGASDLTVLAYARAHRLALPPEVSDADLRWLRVSGVNEAVVRYMAAIDVRASEEWARDAAEPSVGYSYPERDEDSYSSGSYSDGYAGDYSDGYSDTYAGYGYDDYPYSPYDDYAYGSFPYSGFFFVDRDGFFHRFRGRGRRFAGDRRFDGGRDFGRRRGSVAGRRENWRERGFSGNRRTPLVVPRRGPGRPAITRGSLGAGFRGRSGGSRGFVGGRAGFSRPGFSSGPRGGGGFNRGPRAAAGTRGGRGRR